MELDQKTILGIGVILVGVVWFLKDKLSFDFAIYKDYIFSLFLNKETEGVIREDYTPDKELLILKDLWKIRSNFIPDDPIYKNLTSAIEKLIKNGKLDEQELEEEIKEQEGE